MTAQPDSLYLLQDPVAVELLGSRAVARLAYSWPDGSPRVVPMWFHWDGSSVVLGGPARAPKVRILRSEPRVALTIDDASSWPYKALLIRGRAHVDVLDTVTPEYELAARRYLGEDAAEDWCAQLRGIPMARIRVRPEEVRVLDFVTRFPRALVADLADQAARSGQTEPAGQAVT